MAHTYPASRVLKSLGLCIPAVTALWAGGCVEREIQIDSEPQGALVYLNDTEVGRTPVKRDFVWYGTYDVVVRKEGYETLKTKAPVIAPWWQFVPFDLVADILPFRLKDSRKVSFTLKEAGQETVDPKALVGRGEQFRDKLEFGEKNPSSTGPATKPE